MLGIFVVLYLFLGGCGAAAMGATALWSLLFTATRTRTPEQTRAFGRLRQVLYGASFLVVALAALCLLLDLGRPERVLLLFVRPTASLLSVGSFILLGCLLCGAGLLAVSVNGAGRFTVVGSKALEIVCIVLSVGMLFYTGLYLAWLAVPLWNNAALPLLLALSSISSGLAVVLVVAPFCTDWRLLSGWIDLLHKAHGWVLLLELVVFAVFMALAVLDPFAHASLALLFDGGGLRPWLLVGFVGMGLGIPLAAEVFRALLPAPTVMFAAESFCVVGGLILRFCLVVSGTH